MTNLKNRTILRSAKALWSLFFCFNLILLLLCARNNPFDVKSSNYLPGSLPNTQFTIDTISGFINDTLSICVRFSDSSAKGGITPVVSKLIFNWNGESGELTDTVIVTTLDSITIKRFFFTARNLPVFVRAIDNDNELSETGSSRMIISQGTPAIQSVTVPDTVIIGDTVSLTVMAIDTNGRIASYIWGVDYLRDIVTKEKTFKTAFFTSGLHRITIRVKDDDSVMSAPTTVPVVVLNPVLDTIGPHIEHLFPLPGDTVISPVISIAVRTWDQNGVSSLLVNNKPAASVSESDGYRFWKLDSMVLSYGVNELVLFAIDKKGNINLKKMKVYYLPQATDETPPAIVFIAPMPGDTVSMPAINVTVAVTDASNAVSKVLCNNGYMRIAGLSRYASESIPLTAGENTIAIYAVDNVGNDTVVNLIIHHTTKVVTDTAAPSIYIIRPNPDKRIRAIRDTVIVEATDQMSGIDSVLIDGAPAFPLGGNLFAQPVTLNHGYDTIRIVAVDKSPAHNRKTDSIIVLRNVPPHFVPDLRIKDTSLFVGAPATISLQITDPDNDSIVATLVSSKYPGINFKTSADGVVTIGNYTPVSTGTDTFTVVVTDLYQESDTITCIAYIKAVQETKPFFTTKPDTIPQSTIAGSPYTTRVQAMDPNGKPLVFSLHQPPTGAAISNTGMISWTPSIADTGEISFTALIDNGSEGDTLSWIVTVVMPNLPPKLSSLGIQTIMAGSTLQFTIVASDPNGDSLAFSFGSLSPQGAKITRNIFSWTPSSSDAGKHQTIIKVTERNRDPALSDSITFSIEVTKRTDDIEQNGLVVMEVESVPTVGKWQRRTTIKDYSGTAYYHPTADYTSAGGTDILNYEFIVSSAAIFQVQIRSRIAEGNDGTEHNDSWIRLLDAENQIVNPVPNSNEISENGWMKFYQNKLNFWTWQTSNRENNPKSMSWNLSANATYHLQISIRSAGHALDKIVLWNTKLKNLGDKLGMTTVQQRIELDSLQVPKPVK